MSSRYHSPSATAKPCRPKLLITELPLPLRPPAPAAISARKATALIPIRTKVAGARPARLNAAGPLSHPGALLRALRAAHADRGRRHAVGADRAAAAGAGDAGLAVGVAVTSLHAARSLDHRPTHPWCNANEREIAVVCVAPLRADAVGERAQAAARLLPAAAAHLDQHQGAGGDAPGADRDHRPHPVARVAQGAQLALGELLGPVRELLRGRLGDGGERVLEPAREPLRRLDRPQRVGQQLALDAQPIAPSPPAAA